MILAGDVGGTNTRLALFEVRRGRLTPHARREFRNAGHRGLPEIVQEFLQEHTHAIEVACFGVAGPVKGGRVSLTNLKWNLDERSLQRSLRIRRVALINDLVAHAEGTNVLHARDLVTLKPGAPVRLGNRAVLAPGTGLGEAGLLFDHRSDSYRAFPSEGGHCDFSPTDDRELSLLQYARGRFGRCSWEDVLSGPGLRHIWDFLTSRGEHHVASKLRSTDPSPADITGAAASGACPASVATVEMFSCLLGAEAGNLALKVLGTGGVYIGGGIAPKILRYLRRPALRKAFERKGPPNIRKVLRSIPIRVITSTDGALLGAAHYAQRL